MEEVKKAAKARVVTIEELVTNGRQSREYRKIYEEGGYRFQIEIDRDSHDFQSSAVGSVWDKANLKWNVVYNIPHKEMASLQTVNAYASNVQSYHFGVDTLRIMNNMRKIVL